ncbi:DUF262 domain-containing protein [Paenibacillus aceris]|uniref:GmrSD restriction endonucleases N-terminal domain-containing protein n=1 Tax=Paenibacillus aceris TaxID=869555 RepID=A0ABS4I2R4_9BACL|nr:DUF262 domain-containing protein [Paenibacillus aceris]MBP1965189.1 hypothetical protein [Paenibacillus aceris]NHW33169.1 DUF262 domain-containing protein [Paenibacillus aceris]
MEQSNITIEDLYSSVKQGKIRIPAFQRGFVWSSEQVGLLYDSLVKGFPIGNVLFWETTNLLKSDKKLGSIESPVLDGLQTYQYVLDGQQRITSLCTLFNRDILAKDNPDWIDIYFDMESPLEDSKSLFVSLKENEVDLNRYFPVHKIMDSVEYRKATRDLSDEKADKLDRVMRKLSTKVIPIEKMKTDDMKLVSMVFERVNTAGTDLDHYQLLAAWSWSEDFVLQEKFTALASELEDFGIDSQNSNHIDLLLKCCTGVLLNKSSTDSIIELNGHDVRTEFTKIENGIKSSIQFLSDNLKVYDIKYLPYPSMLIPLTKFFATDRAMGDTFSDKQRTKIVKWFWSVGFSKRYSNAIDNKIPRDIEDMDKLRHDENASVFSYAVNLNKDFFKENRFNTTTVATKTFITFLANQSPKSFISGSDIDLDVKLRIAYTTEFHHIFPQKHLERKGVDKGEINMLTNFCFLSKADNIKIKDKDPKEYKQLIEQPELVLEHAVCPPNSFDLSYEEFVEKRNKLLMEKVQKLLS